jgi:hypothetical protein
MPLRIRIVATAACLCCAAASALAQIDVTGRIVSNDDAAAGIEAPDPGLSLVELGAEFAPSLPIHGPGYEGEDSRWELISSKTLEADGLKVLTATYEYPACGAALLFFEAAPDGKFALSGGYCYLFGGKGADIEIILISGEGGALRIVLSCTGHLRGYYADPEDEGSYVPPSDAQETVELIYRPAISA